MEQFGRRFFQCRNTLHLIASLILGGPELAGHAVWNCGVRASRSLPNFDDEGAFRSWIMRLLIDEALSILRQAHSLKDNKRL
jgi:DNA-directed RNA polymerase specialized sigma24 family protein